MVHTATNTAARRALPHLLAHVVLQQLRRPICHQQPRLNRQAGRQRVGGAAERGQQQATRRLHLYGTQGAQPALGPAGGG